MLDFLENDSLLDTLVRNGTVWDLCSLPIKYIVIEYLSLCILKMHVDLTIIALHIYSEFLIILSYSNKDFFFYLS